MKVSYNIDENGVLNIWINNMIHATIQHCENKSKEEINSLIDEILEEQNIAIGD